jgi:hypothetical protein
VGALSGAPADRSQVHRSRSVAAFGASTVAGPFATLEIAAASAVERSAYAKAKGEPNEPERHGWRLDWGDPKTWE